MTSLYGYTSQPEFTVDVGGNTLLFIPGLTLEISQFASPTQIRASRELQSRVLSGDVVLNDGTVDIDTATAFEQVFGRETFRSEDASEWQVVSVDPVSRLEITPGRPLTGSYTLSWKCNVSVSRGHRSPIITVEKVGGLAVDSVNPLMIRPNMKTSLSGSFDIDFDNETPTYQICVRGDRMDYATRVSHARLELERKING